MFPFRPHEPLIVRSEHTRYPITNSQSNPGGRRGQNLRGNTPRYPIDSLFHQPFDCLGHLYLYRFESTQGAVARDRAPKVRRQTSDVPRRCRFRQAGDPRGAGIARSGLRDPDSGQQEPGVGDRKHPVPSAGQAFPQAAGALQKLPLPRVALLPPKLPQLEPNLR